MKVVQVLYSGLGGHGSVVSSLVRADKNKSWQHQLLFYGIEELLPAYRDFCVARAIPFFSIRKRQGLFRLPGKEVYTAFKKLAPDCIILHSPTLILPAWLYSFFHRKKLFVVEHTPHASKGRAEKLAGFLSLLLARKTVCLSAAYREEIKKRTPLLNTDKRTTVIRNGIDLDRFVPRISTGKTGYHIGMAGRFSRQKNQALLLDIFISGIKDGRINRDTHLHFAGDGETLPELQEKTERAGLGAQVHFHGLLKEEALISFLGKLDLYLHASKAETMCTSVMQALACGLPVIGSDIPGINDLLPPENKSIEVLPNDKPEWWLNLIVEYQYIDHRVEKSGLARQAAEQFFSATETFSAYSKLIEN